MTQTAEFYRRQAANFLAQAEVIERLARLGAVPAGTVITFTRGTRHYGSYAAIVIQNPDPMERGPYEGRKWYVTNAGRYKMGPYSDEEFIKWLMDGDAKDVLVVNSYLTLEQWAAATDDKTSKAFSETLTAADEIVNKMLGTD